MKKYIVAFMALLLVSCSDHQLMESLAEMEESESVKENTCGNVGVNTLIKRARWGDGQAYLQLADCYRDGIGVDKDLGGMICMVLQAKAHGALDNEMDYMKRIPDDNELKRFFDLMDKSRSQLREEKDSLMAQMSAVDCPDALVLYGLACMESGDTVSGVEIIRNASERGSNLATLLNAMSYRNGKYQPDKVKLEQIAERIPLAYKFLGKLSLESDENGKIDEQQVAYYYLKADEHALLSRKEARWLLDYHGDAGIPQLTDEDLKRLKTFIGISDVKDEAVKDTLSVDGME